MGLAGLDSSHAATRPSHAGLSHTAAARLTCFLSHEPQLETSATQIRVVVDGGGGTAALGMLVRTYQGESGDIVMLREATDKALQLLQNAAGKVGRR